jgi:hypothetical protein
VGAVLQRLPGVPREQRLLSRADLDMPPSRGNPFRGNSGTQLGKLPRILNERITMI